MSVFATPAAAVAAAVAAADGLGSLCSAPRGYSTHERPKSNVVLPVSWEKQHTREVR